MFNPGKAADDLLHWSYCSVCQLWRLYEVIQGHLSDHRILIV